MSEIVKKESSAGNMSVREEYGATPMQMMKAAIEKGVDPQILDKLMDLQERWDARNERMAASVAKAAYDKAMAEMQAELPVIEKSRNGDSGKWKYADWADIRRQINSILSKHGFSITHRSETTDSALIVTAIASHKDGHREETSMPLPFDGSGSKNVVQARGSSFQYGIRYTGCAILGIAVGGEDHDGADHTDFDLEPWRADLLSCQTQDEISSFAKTFAKVQDVPQWARKAIASEGAKRRKQLSSEAA